MSSRGARPAGRWPETACAWGCSAAVPLPLGVQALVPSSIAVPDPERAAADLQRLEALVDAYGGDLPGPLRVLPEILQEERQRRERPEERGKRP